MSFCRCSKGIVGVQDFVEFKSMGDQLLGIDPARLHRLEQHWRGYGVDEPRRDRDVAVPQSLQVQIRLNAMHADIGDDAAGVPRCLRM